MEKLQHGSSQLDRIKDIAYAYEDNKSKIGLLRAIVNQVENRLSTIHLFEDGTYGI